MARVGRVTTLAALACATALSACGGSDDSGSATTKATTPTTATRPQSPPKKPELGALPTNALGRQETPAVTALINRLLVGVSRHDQTVCTTVYTQHQVEALTGQKGAAAVKACRKSVSGVKYKASLKQVEGISLRRGAGGRITGQAQVIEQVRDKPLRVRFTVIKTAHGYRIDDAKGEDVRPTSSSG